MDRIDRLMTAVKRLRSNTNIVLLLDGESTDFEERLATAQDGTIVIIDDITAEMAAHPPIYFNGDPLPPRLKSAPAPRKKRKKERKKDNLPSSNPHCI